MDSIDQSDHSFYPSTTCLVWCESHSAAPAYTGFQAATIYYLHAGASNNATNPDFICHISFIPAKVPLAMALLLESLPATGQTVCSVSTNLLRDNDLLRVLTILLNIFCAVRRYNIRDPQEYCCHAL